VISGLRLRLSRAEREWMSPEDWEHVPNFTPEELGAVDMNRELMFKLQAFRDAIRHPVVVHCGYEDRRGYHGKKMAVDFHISGHKDWWRQFELLLQVGFKGVGWYPQWNNPGWHVDVREHLLIWRRVDGVYDYFVRLV